MALPKLNTPTYETVVPSTGEVIEFRPFLVKEEKILLLAQESDSSREILKAMQEIIKTCTFDKLDVNKLASYDLEYLFTQLRARSVGEQADLKVKCESCGEYNPVGVDLTEVEVKFPEEKPESTVMLNDQIGVTLRAIPVKSFDKFSEGNDAAMAGEMLAACIETIFDEDEVYTADDASDKEMEEFIDSLSRKQAQKIEDFISKQPQLTHDIEFKCEHCGHLNRVTLSGMNAFFE